MDTKYNIPTHDCPVGISLVPIISFVASNLERYRFANHNERLLVIKAESILGGK